MFRILDNLFDLCQVGLSKIAKHWDGFLSNCTLDDVPPEVFSFCTNGGATFGVLGLADTVEVDGTKEQGLGGGAGCFPLDTGGVGI